ncbi:hypothetical protein [Blautia producta]
MLEKDAAAIQAQVGLAEEYGVYSYPVIRKMQEPLEELVRKAGSIYA